MSWLLPSRLRASAHSGRNPRPETSANPGTVISPSEGERLMWPSGAGAEAAASAPAPLGHINLSPSDGEITVQNSAVVSGRGFSTGRSRSKMRRQQPNSSLRHSTARAHGAQRPSPDSTASPRWWGRQGRQRRSACTLARSACGGQTFRGLAAAWTAVQVLRLRARLPRKLDGNVTAKVRFSISPDGTCDGAVCSAAHRGPHRVTAMIPSSSISTGWGAHSCATTTIGLRCWGENFSGETGSNAFGDDWTPRPSPASTQLRLSRPSCTPARSRGPAARSAGATAPRPTGNATAMSSRYADRRRRLTSGAVSLAATNNACAITSSHGVKC